MINPFLRHAVAGNSGYIPEPSWPPYTVPTGVPLNGGGTLIGDFPNAPTGTVTFSNIAGVTLATAAVTPNADQTSSTVDVVNLGSFTAPDTITATYSGDANYFDSVSTQSFTVV